MILKQLRQTLEEHKGYLFIGDLFVMLCAILLALASIPLLQLITGE